MTVQLLRAQGCRVLGIDFDPDAGWSWRERFGAETVDLSPRRTPSPRRRHSPAGAASMRCSSRRRPRAASRCIRRR